MYYEALEKRQRIVRAQKEKEKIEIEEAVAMSQMPRSKIQSVSKTSKRTRSQARTIE